MKESLYVCVCLHLQCNPFTLKSSNLACRSLRTWSAGYEVLGVKGGLIIITYEVTADVTQLWDPII